MTRSKLVQFRVSTQLETKFRKEGDSSIPYQTSEFLEIKAKARAMGFKENSKYIRHLIFNDKKQQSIINELQALNKTIKGFEPDLHKVPQEIIIKQGITLVRKIRFLYSEMVKKV